MGKQVDKNDFWFIEKNPITKVGVYPYLGKQISQDCEPDKIYYVLRPKEELFRKETLDSLRLIPLIDGHTMIGKDFTAPEDKGLDGTLGDNVSHDTDTIYNDLKIISNKMKEEIKNGKKELSLGYFCRYDKQPGTYKGQRYDYVQRDIIANHLALVDKGRMGADVRVYDSKNIPEGEAFAMDSIDIAIDKDEDIEWITVRGTHVPIKKGATEEQKSKTIEQFFKMKRATNKEDVDVFENEEKRKKFEKLNAELHGKKQSSGNEDKDREYRNKLFKEATSKVEEKKKESLRNELKELQNRQKEREKENNENRSFKDRMFIETAKKREQKRISEIEAELGKQSGNKAENEQKNKKKSFAEEYNETYKSALLNDLLYNTPALKNEKKEDIERFVEENGNILTEENSKQEKTPEKADNWLTGYSSEEEKFADQEQMIKEFEESDKYWTNKYKQWKEKQQPKKTGKSIFEIHAERAAGVDPEKSEPEQAGKKTEEKGKNYAAIRKISKYADKNFTLLGKEKEGFNEFLNEVYYENLNDEDMEGNISDITWKAIKEFREYNEELEKSGQKKFGEDSMEYKTIQGEGKMADKKEKVAIDEDKRKIIDEIGGILKDEGLDDEIIRTVIGKAEKIAYNKSEAGDDGEEVEEEVIEEENEEKDKKPAKDKCGKDEEKDKEEEEKKKVVKAFAQKEKLGKEVEDALGTFDHSEMTELEIAKYACDKLDLEVEKGQEISAVKGYLKGLAKAPKATFGYKTVAADSGIQTTDAEFEKFVNKGE